MVKYFAQNMHVKFLYTKIKIVVILNLELCQCKFQKGVGEMKNYGKTLFPFDRFRYG
jgi:hypothetical protein